MIELFKYYRLEYSKNDDNEYDSSKHAKLVDLIKLFNALLFLAIAIFYAFRLFG